MSPGPESPLPRPRVRAGAAWAVAAVALALAVALAVPDALAQSGLGAQRYEVTITPPKKPGSETAPPASPEAAVQGGDVGAGAGAAGEDLGAAAPSAEPVPDASTAGSAAAPSSAPGTPAAAPAPAVAAKAAQTGPPRTLQVGAFRQKGSAEDLHDKLRRSFDDVSVVEVQSGGQPLYRVYVGRLPKGPALEDLKRRLSAAGHPSFDVPAPSLPAAN